MLAMKFLNAADAVAYIPVKDGTSFCTSFHALVNQVVIGLPPFDSSLSQPRKFFHASCTSSMALMILPVLRSLHALLSASNVPAMPSIASLAAGLICRDRKST